jgi:hypothetical protein
VYASVADPDTDSIRLVDPDPGAQKMKKKNLQEKVKKFRFRSYGCFFRGLKASAYRTSYTEA